MIVVIDYNVGNVKSVCNAFTHIGCEVRLSCDPGVIAAATGIVLPGVAAFGYAVNELGSLAEPIKDLALSGKPLMGICVGYQMLFDRSCEYGEHTGLGLVSGDVRGIPTGRVIPHMGWNQLRSSETKHPLMRGIDDGSYVYYANSYAVPVGKYTVATTQYGAPFSAIVSCGNFYGMQFHPEKSGATGERLLRNFLSLEATP